MSEQVLKIYRGPRGVDFIEAIWPGRNTSGLKVHGRNILVLMDEASPTQGAIILPDDEVWKRTQRAQTGVICHIGPEAFRHFADGSPWVGDKPKPGERVYVEEYAGILMQGLDGKPYRSMDCNCIAAGYDEAGLAAANEEAA